MSRPKGRSDRDDDLTSRIGRWEGRDWDELVAIWEQLVPESRDSALTPKPDRRFQGSRVNPQQAGNVFQRWIMSAFRLAEVEVKYPYRVPIRGTRGNTLEEIDGLVLDGWQGFLVQSKFWPSKPVDYKDLTLLINQVEKRPWTTLGLFFAAFRVSEPAIINASGSNPMRLLLFQQQDIDWAIRHRDMMGLVRLKWRLAVQYGRFDSEVE